ncbi:MAG: prfB [Candidatus Saccharibacteria bacterium]|nr:prfB [Candidatus Saccharibacteria bacterium]
MQDILKRAELLRIGIVDAIDKLHLLELESELAGLQIEIQEPDFWSNNLKAQETMKQVSRLEGRVRPWRELEKIIFDVIELAEANEASLLDDLEAQLGEAEKQYDALKAELKFSGPYDDMDAILSIHAGAGGTDAQDWVQMLMRMYVRYAEAHGFTVATVDESPGEEAGLKSITLEMSGPFAYGKLKGEHGVHRLVRLSPFNSDNLRQTSFAKVEVLPKIDKPDVLVIDDKDLKIDVFRSGGHGGQSVNTTDSAVRVTHLPTNIVIVIQNERSQIQNKETAMTILRSKLAQLQIEQHQESLRDIKGPNQSAEWGNQIRSYVLHPYKQVKDLRSRHETSDAEGVLDGNLAPFIDAYLEHSLGE